MTRHSQFELYGLFFEARCAVEWQREEGDSPAGWIAEMESFEVTLPDGSGDLTQRFTIDGERAWLNFIAMQPSFSVGEFKPWRVHELPSYAEIEKLAEAGACEEAAESAESAKGEPSDE